MTEKRDLPKWERVKAKPWHLMDPQYGRVSEVTLQERLDLCRACPQLIKLTQQCKQCGCHMPSKAKLPHAICPLNKWLQADIDSVEDLG
jgi:hypothetical protein